MIVFNFLNDSHIFFFVGWCCRKGVIKNGCDGSIGGDGHHACVLRPGKVYNLFSLFKKQPLLSSQGWLFRFTYEHIKLILDVFNEEILNILCLSS